MPPKADADSDPRISEIEIVQESPRAEPSFGGPHVLDFDSQHHVLCDGAPRQQQILLQHEGDMGIGPFDALPVDKSKAVAGRRQAGADIKEGAFATAAWADE